MQVGYIIQKLLKKHINEPLREVGNQILNVEQLKKLVDGRVLFNKVSFTINKGDKIAFVSKDPLAVTYFFEIINGNEAADAGSFEWGSTITKACLPLESIQSFNEQCIAYNGVVLLT